MQSSPKIDYESRLSQRRAQLTKLDQADLLLANLRLAAFVAVALTTVAVALRWCHGSWLLIPVAAFLALVIAHAHVIARKEQMALAVAFYERGLLRLANRWQGTGNTRTDLVSPTHPYATDLDLFGRGSLFELLCTVHTRTAEEILARWLCEAPTLDEVRERHEALNELRQRTDLREQLSLIARRARGLLHPAALIQWGSAAPLFDPPQMRLWRACAWLLPISLITTALLWISGVLGPIPCLLALSAQCVAHRFARRRLQTLCAAVEPHSHELLALVRLLARLQHEPFASPRLTRMQAQLGHGHHGAAHCIKKLDRLVTALDAQRNQLFAPFALLLMWSLHFGLRIEAWRHRFGGHIATWLHALGELEVLTALAGYAYEHPHDPLPELVDGERGIFDGQKLGHPLLDEAKCVTNDVHLDTNRLYLVSGSNMSGKSTLLRTVGINGVLAMAGCPVRAQHLRVSRLALGSSIRVHDSLQSGASHFYAEISRVKQVMDMTASSVPVLFLLDEIFHGTNSNDRRLGAQAVLLALMNRQAIGLATTHDLALTHIADTLDGVATNVHFADQLVDGRLVFDYRMKPGVVATSNALELMRAVGLPI